MDKFKLAFAIHNHQPVGNFDYIFEYAHQKAYASFLELLKQYPDFRISLHQSGILWDWQEKKHPQYLELINDLIKQRQLSLMTGGFYEPILTSIPERDVKGQITSLNQYLKKHFDVIPEGLWLTERIWEPHLPKVLAQSGVKFLPVDDTHFIYAGWEENQLTGPFVTENENYKVILLPISKQLRYLIPFGTVEEVIDELKEKAEINPEGMVIYADDGEKFGVWPGTYEHCYKKKWLELFFEAIADNSDWLEVIPLDEAAKVKPVGRAYLPSASYAEMLHWSLPPKAFVEYENFENYLKDNEVFDRFDRFVRGGHWRNFLSKYEESNLMHKKMLSVSEKLLTCEQKAVLNRKLLEQAKESLYAAQCNCPYWHGVFGGLYLPHIRQAIYAHLIKADNILNNLLGNSDLHMESKDYDADGKDEVIVTSKPFTSVFKPEKGGSMIELSLNEHDFSLTDTLSRRKEGYHLKLKHAKSSSDEDGTTSIHDLIIAKEEGLEKYLVEDWYLKRCFLDHFFTDDVYLDNFQEVKFGEEGDFTIEPYETEINKNDGEVIFTRKGHIWRPGRVIPIKVVKHFRFNNERATIEVLYELTSQDYFPVEVNFAIENNFNFQAGHAEDRFISIDGKRHENSFLDSIGSYYDSKTFMAIDRYRHIAVALNAQTPAEIWHMPIFTVSLSEAGFEKVYQGTTFVNKYHLSISERPVKLSFTLLTGTPEEVSQGLKTLSMVAVP